MPRVLDKTLYLQTPGLNVELEQGALQVEGDDLPAKVKVPLHEIEGVVLFGGVNMTQPLALRLADLGVAVLTQSGDFRARLSGSLEGSPEARVNQYFLAQDAKTSTYFATQFIRSKINNNLRLLAARRAKMSSNPQMDSARQSVMEAQGVHESVLKALTAATSVEHVVSIEAGAAQAYFQVCGHLLSKEGGFIFAGRNRRPPRDPVNAMLSFGYTLLANECEGALQAGGLDPAVGFMHRLRAGRASLALDLEEELRSVVVDALVIGIANRRSVRPDMFSPTDQGGVLMSPEARGKFLDEYERRKQRLVPHPEYAEMVPIGLLPHIQARSLARASRQPELGYEGYLV